MLKSKKKNLVQREKEKQDFKNIIDANKQCYDFMKELKLNYPFNDQEDENIEMLKTNLLNMNFIFNTMLSNMK